MGEHSHCHLVWVRAGGPYAPARKERQRDDCWAVGSAVQALWVADGQWYS
eukprot:SAG25_NODE_2567_length_1528_cov_4.970498_1_plen_49_part_10